MMKLFAGVVASGALAAGAVMVVGPHLTRPGGAPLVQRVISPSDTFTVHDAPAPVDAPQPPPAPGEPSAGGLDAAIERLRATAAKPEPSPANAPPDPVIAPPAPAPVAAPAPPPAAPLPPPPTWTVMTSQGARWRASYDGSGPLLLIDMGGGRVATVHVDPAFQSLPAEAANARVDFLKQTILEAFSPGASQFRFGRDGSVSLLR